MTTRGEHAARAWASTPPRAGAIAVMTVRGQEDALRDALGVEAPPVGRVRLARLFDVDEGVLARVDERTLLITPHGGRGVVGALLERLSAAGVLIAGSDAIDPRDAHPEASDVFEARALRAIALAPSPMAIALLSEQPERWRALARAASPGGFSAERVEALRAQAEALRPLLEPPVVAVVGRANVGKSTLLNALARRTLSVVDERPGATRDHVGATLDLGGLVVRWIDTPGIREEADAEEREASAIAGGVVAAADLVIVCGDAASGFPDPDEVRVERERLLLVATRADLGAPAEVGQEAIAVSVAARGEASGLERLCRAIRRRLVPEAAVRSDEAWLFDEGLLEDVTGGGAA